MKFSHFKIRFKLEEITGVLQIQELPTGQQLGNIHSHKHLYKLKSDTGLHKQTKNNNNHIFFELTLIEKEINPGNGTVLN